MKITFVLAAADLSGGSRVISIYADRLQRRGHQVTLVSRPWRIPSLKDKLVAFLRRRPMPSSTQYGPSHFDHLQGVEHQRIKTFRPITADDVPDGDVVIATWWETAEWVADYPRQKGRKCFFIQHYEAHVGQDAARVNAAWRLPLHKIVVAQWLADLAKEKFADKDVSLVTNAVDLEQFNAPLRNKHSIPTVGVMYSIVPFKGCDVSLAAFELAKKKIPNLKLVSFGNRQPTAQLVLPAQTQYTMQPPQDQIKKIYAQCDVWLVGSRSEGFGLPILEAMACRTPVIATPTGAAPQLLVDGGVLVPIDDAPAMAEQIERIAKLSPAQWQTLSNAAHATAQKYTWEHSTTLFEAALQSANKRPNRK